MEQSNQKQGQTTLHDWGYQQLFSDPKIFMELLHNFVTQKEILQEVTAEMIQPVNKTYIYKEFQGFEADVIYRLNWRGREVFLYLIIKTESLCGWRFRQRLFWSMYRILHDAIEPEEGTVNLTVLKNIPEIFVVRLTNLDVWNLYQMTCEEAGEDIDPNYESYRPFNSFSGSGMWIQNIDIHSLRLNDENRLNQDNLVSKVFMLDQREITNLYEKIEHLIELLHYLSIEQYALLKEWLLELTLRVVPADKWCDEVKKIFAQSDQNNLDTTISALSNLRKMIWDEKYAEGYKMGVKYACNKIAESLLKKDAH